MLFSVRTSSRSPRFGLHLSSPDYPWTDEHENRLGNDHLTTAPSSEVFAYQSDGKDNNAPTTQEPGESASIIPEGRFSTVSRQTRILQDRFPAWGWSIISAAADLCVSDHTSILRGFRRERETEREKQLLVTCVRILQTTRDVWHFAANLIGVKK